MVPSVIIGFIEHLKLCRVSFEIVIVKLSYHFLYYKLRWYILSSYLPCHVVGVVDVCDDFMQFIISVTRQPKAGYEQQDDFHCGAHRIARHFILYNISGCRVLINYRIESGQFRNVLFFIGIRVRGVPTILALSRMYCLS